MIGWLATFRRPRYPLSSNSRRLDPRSIVIIIIISNSIIDTPAQKRCHLAKPGSGKKGGTERDARHDAVCFVAL
jgi:hypothetical protein